MTRNRIAIVIILVFMMSGSVWAHHVPGSIGAGQAGPVLTGPATTLQKGRMVFSLQTAYVDSDAFSNRELLGFADNGHDVHTFDDQYSVSASFAYGITDDLMLSLKLPYNSIDNIKEAHSDEPGEIHLHGDARGIGDMALLGQYRFLKMPSRQFESAVLFGLKTPTGNTHKKDIQGERFETEHQPGSGSWDPNIGLAATKRFGRVSLDADARYTFVTEGAQDTDLGDLFNYDFAFSYHIPGKFPLDLVLEANGEWKQKQEINGTRDENSGEHVLFLSPGMRISLNNRFSAFISVGFPVIQDLNGIQSESNYHAAFGISVGL